jgi:chloramphenicol-sensitive protein RarD
MNPGVLFGLAAFGLWGVLPAYFKLLEPINALEILAWRVLCSVAFVGLILLVQRRIGWLLGAVRDVHLWKVALGSATLIGMNWYVFIWAVTHGRLVEAALGYFINPLVNVLAAALWLHERLRRLQWVAVALAAAGVGWITWHHGSLPWVSLALPLTFAGYGLIRRAAPLGAVEGLALETLALAPVALAGLLIATSRGAVMDITQASPALRGWVLASGPATAVPLLLYAAAARRLPFSTLGMLQYVGPSVTLAIGVLAYGEPFAGARAEGFVAIWAACAIFSAELWRHHRRSAVAATAPA